MAVEYDLWIETDLGRRDILNTLSGVAGLTPDKERFTGRGLTDLSVYTDDSAVRPKMIEENFRFRPGLRVGFVIDKFEESLAGEELMVRSAIALLKRCGKNGVLVYGFERAVLITDAGKLLLDRDWWDAWEELLKEVAIRYEIKKLPQPLL